MYGTVPVCMHDCAAKLKFLAGAEKPNDDNSTSWCVCVFIDEAQALQQSITDCKHGVLAYVK